MKRILIQVTPIEVEVEDQEYDKIQSLIAKSCSVSAETNDGANRLLGYAMRDYFNGIMFMPSNITVKALPPKDAE